MTIAMPLRAEAGDDIAWAWLRQAGFVSRHGGRRSGR